MLHPCNPIFRGRLPNTFRPGLPQSAAPELRNRRRLSVSGTRATHAAGVQAGLTIQRAGNVTTHGKLDAR
jgi:hypothetical protein